MFCSPRKILGEVDFGTFFCSEIFQIISRNVVKAFHTLSPLKPSHVGKKTQKHGPLSKNSRFDLTGQIFIATCQTTSLQMVMKQGNRHPKCPNDFTFRNDTPPAKFNECFIFNIGVSKNNGAPNHPF